MSKVPPPSVDPLPWKQPACTPVTGHDVHFIYVSYPEKLLTVAQELIDKGEFTIAAVVAYMACEISVEWALSRAFKAKGIDYLQQPIKDLGFTYNLANDRVCKLYNAVAGDEVQKQSFWDEFKASATRRKWRRSCRKNRDKGRGRSFIHHCDRSILSHT
jgi:hypothetical protein